MSKRVTTDQKIEIERLFDCGDKSRGLQKEIARIVGVSASFVGNHLNDRLEVQTMKTFGEFDKPIESTYAQRKAYLERLQHDPYWINYKEPTTA